MSEARAQGVGSGNRNRHETQGDGDRSRPSVIRRPLRRRQRHPGNPGDDRPHSQELPPPRPLPQPLHPQPKQQNQPTGKARLHNRKRCQQQRPDLQRPPGKPQRRSPKPTLVPHQPSNQGRPQRVLPRHLPSLQRLKRDRGVVEQRSSNRRNDAEGNHEPTLIKLSDEALTGEARRLEAVGPAARQRTLKSGLRPLVR